MKNVYLSEYFKQSLLHMSWFDNLGWLDFRTCGLL